MIEKKKVYDFTTEICGGDVKGYIVLHQYNKTEEEAHKEIVKAMAKLGAKYYSTQKEDRGQYRAKIPQKTLAALEKKLSCDAIQVSMNGDKIQASVNDLGGAKAFVDLVVEQERKEN